MHTSIKSTLTQPTRSERINPGLSPTAVNDRRSLELSVDRFGGINSCKGIVGDRARIYQVALPGCPYSGQLYCVTLAHPEPVGIFRRANPQIPNRSSRWHHALFCDFILINVCFAAQPLPRFLFLFSCSLPPTTRACCYSDRRDWWHWICDSEASGQTGHARHHRWWFTSTTPCVLERAGDTQLLASTCMEILMCFQTQQGQKA